MGFKCNCFLNISQFINKYVSKELLFKKKTQDFENSLKLSCI